MCGNCGIKCESPINLLHLYLQCTWPIPTTLHHKLSRFLLVFWKTLHHLFPEAVCCPQFKGLSPVWPYMCVCKELGRAKRLSQALHLCFFCALADILDENCPI